VPILLEELRRGYQGENHDYDRRFDMFLNVPLLVLDDLGTENPTPWVQEKLDTIIDYRLMHGLATIITSNLALDQMPERIGSRLLRTGKVVTINAGEHRRSPSQKVVNTQLKKEVR
jgi:DNA replication protein DnaC